MRAFAGLFLVVLVAAGCGGGSSAAPDEGAGVFMTRVLREELSGQWSKQWNELHPGHKKLITRAQYVACSRALATNIGTGDETYRVLAVKDDTIHVFAVPQHDSKVVTITFRSPISNTAPRYDMHAVNVDGRWTWILGGRFLSQVEHGRCLDGTPLKQLATGVQS
jgi:hypothetical protein